MDDESVVAYRVLTRFVLAFAFAVALIVAVPVGLVSLSNASHNSACTSIPDRTQRLWCLTGGTPQTQAIRQCGSLIGQAPSGAVDQCIAEAMGRSYAAGGAAASSSATSSSGG